MLFSLLLLVIALTLTQAGEMEHKSLVQPQFQSQLTSPPVRKKSTQGKKLHVPEIMLTQQLILS